MTPGKRDPYISIKFTVWQIICRTDTIAVDVLHADDKFHIFSKKMCKDIEAFISTICHQNCGYRIRITIHHGVCSTFVQILFTFHHLTKNRTICCSSRQDRTTQLRQHFPSTPNGWWPGRKTGLRDDSAMSYDELALDKLGAHFEWRKTIWNFFASAIDTLKILVIAIGAGLGVWGVVNLLEGYDSDNPGANAHVP